ncbi:uncharacterized protein MONOS_6003 [Monocercomonoides exilis]|uniref:uncharacterized protein n=1 Tax=Monocercomonoides exilis TaxID=2049356 RepID=UPI0035594A13|nr:hypothetical protein MONOS_6003 [Monocercomonoides exilis]|eukprot:MONOS_6003.1-p1 / transcript=MONOS_6003.1 / gene=MONOS_6003 / organism=Monocercomonoides_exilis_PA203 / gene_product=unspecified product / transcript_product=unspecified product / location=Mono_scaffold00183:4021-4566(+) / protein_length=182 / sequence_SO=supercontig / SO=protein_coding / is_pseudo=false
MEKASGNYLLPRRAGTTALHVRAPSSDSAHSACARPQGCSSGAHRSASQHQAAGAHGTSPQQAYGSNETFAQACAWFSPEATRSFVIVQPFNQLELSSEPHGQFFSNCQEHNITFDFEGKCGVLFQLAGHLVAGVVGFAAYESSVELAVRTATRALETGAVQMLRCALISVLGWEDKKRME